MSINVKTENAKDSTVQVHIAFENGAPYRGKGKTPKKWRATRQWNNAGLRDGEPFTLQTGKNSAEHQSGKKKQSQQLALPGPSGYQ